MLKYIPRMSRLSSAPCFYGGSSSGPKQARNDLLTQEDLQNMRKFITVNPNYQERPLAAYSWLPKLKFLYSPTVVKFLATCFSSNQAEGASDVLVPPKTHENGVFLYQSLNLGSQIRFARSLDWLIGGFLLAGSAYPLFSVAIIGFSYIAGMNAYVYELSRRLVTRMDLLPHTQQVIIQRAGAFGHVYSKLIKIEDLEHVTYDSVSKNENYFWGLNYQTVDPQLIFRDKSTGELFMFDKTGVWNRQGIEHPLLN